MKPNVAYLVLNFCALWGYTELKTNLPGGRHANVRTMRAVVVNADGSRRRLLAEDLAKESNSGKLVFFTSKIGENVELFQTPLDGNATQLTKTAAGSLHYHPQPSPDGKRLVYGSKRDGVRNIYVMTLANRSEKQITNLKAGQGAMWPHWQPADSPNRPK
jgi:hypothetical protein